MMSERSIILGTAVAILGIAGGSTLWLSPGWLAFLVSSTVLFLVALLIWATVRHIQLLANRQTVTWPKPRDPSSAASSSPVVLSRPQDAIDYHLLILGSGGHTKELLMMMDDGFTSFHSFHRRYLISSGDGMSENHLEDYEADLRSACAKQGTDPGSYDKAWVHRARRVHQPLWSVPLSATLSLMDILSVLMTPPPRQSNEGRGRRLRFPKVIVSNGPATGFFVAVAAWMLKMFHLAPEDSMRFVYIESWARISTLSVTGKLFHYTGLADVFLVQHEEVAKKYGVVNAGPMVFNSRRADS